MLIISGVSAYFLAQKYQDKIISSIVSELNKHIETEVKVKEIHFSLLKKFPFAAVEFNNVLIHSTQEYLKQHPHKDTLLYAQKIFLQFNIIDLYYEKYNIKKVSLEDAIVNLYIDKKERDNYHFTKTSSDSTQSVFSTDLNNILLKNVQFQFANDLLKSYFVVSTEDFSAKGNFSDKSFLLNTSGAIALRKVQIADVNYLLQKNTALKVNLSIDEKEILVHSGTINLGQEQLQISGSYIYQDSNSINLQISSKKIAIDNLLRSIPPKYLSNMQDFKGLGNLAFDMNISGEIAKRKAPQIEVSALINNAVIQNTKNDISLTEVNAKAYFSSAKSQLKITNFSAKLLDSYAKGNIDVKNMSHPVFQSNWELEGDLSNIKQFLSLDSLQELNGMLTAQLNWSGRLASNKEVSKKDIGTFRTSGNIKIKNANITFVDDQKRRLKNVNASLRLNNNNLRIDNLKLVTGHSNIKIKGTATHVLEAILLENKTIYIAGSLYSDSLDMNDVLNKQKESDSTKAIKYPQYLDLDFVANIKKIQQDRFHAQNVTAHILLNAKQLLIKDFSMNSAKGAAKGDLILRPEKDKTFHLAIHSFIKNVDINQMMYEFKDFSQNAISYKNINGRITAQTELTASLNEQLKIETPQLNVVSDIQITNGELKNYKPLYSLSKFIDIDDLKNIKFQIIKNTLIIKDEILKIPQMKIQSSAINMDIFGEHHFNKEYQYHIKLLLSEVLGKKSKKTKDEDFSFIKDDGVNKARLFLLLTGDNKNMKIKYDRKELGNHIKENIKKEKTNLKTILNEEFGIFKKDSAVIKSKQKKKKKSTKENFKIEW